MILRGIFWVNSNRLLEVMVKLASFILTPLSHIGGLEAPNGVFITPSFLSLLNSFGLDFSSVLG